LWNSGVLYTGPKKKRRERGVSVQREFEKWDEDYSVISISKNKQR